MTRKLGNLQILEIEYLIIERKLEYKISKSKKDICESEERTDCNLVRFFSRLALNFRWIRLYGRKGWRQKYISNLSKVFHNTF